MGPTMSLLTAAGLLVAQTGEPAVNTGKNCNCQKGTTTGHVQPVAEQPSKGPIVGRLFRGDSSTINDDRPSIFTRIQGMFKRGESAPIERATSEPPVEQIKPGLVRPMQRMPAGQPTGQTIQPAAAAPTAVPPAPVKTVQPVTYQGTPTASAVPAQSATQVALPAPRPNRISPDLVGKIGHETDYSWITGQLHVDNGVWVIHYATPEVVDQHNGSLPLSGTPDQLRGYQDGDFVSVRGTVATGLGGRASYRLTGIDRLPR